MQNHHLLTPPRRIFPSEQGTASNATLVLTEVRGEAAWSCENRRYSVQHLTLGLTFHTQTCNLVSQLALVTITAIFVGMPFEWNHDEQISNKAMYFGCSSFPPLMGGCIR